MNMLTCFAIFVSKFICLLLLIVFFFHDKLLFILKKIEWIHKYKWLKCKYVEQILFKY